MAGASTPLQCFQQEVTCSVCLDYYKDPVTINCGHSFCRECITRHWVKDDYEFSCPQCGKRFRGGSFKLSQQLANVTEIAKQMQLQRNEMALCDLHGEGLTLFCKEDQTMLCVLCQEAEGHKAHTVIPAEEAAQECKVQLHKVLDLLKADMKNFSTWQSNKESTLSQWQDTIKEKQRLIAHSFRKAHQFLKEEETFLLRRLEHEDHEMLCKLEENLDAMSWKRTLVQELVTEIEAKALKPAPELLKDTKNILARRNSLRIQKPAEVLCRLQLKYCLPGILEMLGKYAVPMTLDPETAHWDLILSEDGKHVKHEPWREFKLGLRNQPSNPERFCGFPAVLGTWRFASGRHYWEIEYELGTNWEVGVCLESVSRKLLVERETSPDAGFWTASTEFNLPVDLEKSTRVQMGIFLDYETGEVTFYSVPERTAIFTHFDTFSGIVRPFFQTFGLYNGDWLTMCPMSSPV